jgi:hypothetical protein
MNVGRRLPSSALVRQARRNKKKFREIPLRKKECILPGNLILYVRTGTHIYRKHGMYFWTL